MLVSNLSFGDWERMPLNNSIFAATSNGRGQIVINNPFPDYPSIPRPPCAGTVQLEWPGAGNSWGAFDFEPTKSNLLVVTPAQANSRANNVGCTWTTVQVGVNTTVQNNTLRIATASFITPLNSTYQTPIAFQMLCTVIDTMVTSWTATPIDGMQLSIPVANCQDTLQGCYSTESLWSEANYTQLLSVGLDDPAGSGSKVTCSKIRAVDLSASNASIGEFALLPWQPAMAGATLLLGVYGNQSSPDPQFNFLSMRNYWTFGDLCDGSESAKIILIPPPPPPPQNIAEQMGWSFVYIGCFIALACIIGVAFRGCKPGATGGKNFEAINND